MTCPRCGKENQDGNRFCGNCGAEIVEKFEPESVPGEEGLYYCYKHKREQTRVTCGRCGRPVCTRCVVIGPAGPRCPECARQNISFRPAAFMHSIQSSLRNITRGGPWSIYIWILIIMMVLSFFRGCIYLNQTQQLPPPEELENFPPPRSDIHEAP